MRLSHAISVRTCSFALSNITANGLTVTAEGRDCTQDGPDPQPVRTQTLIQQQLEGAKYSCERVVAHLQCHTAWCQTANAETIDNIDDMHDRTRGAIATSV